MHLPAPPFGLRKGPPGRYLGLWLSALPPVSQTTAKLAGARSVLVLVLGALWWRERG